MNPTTGYVIFAHGSSVESANEAVRRLSAAFAQHQNSSFVQAAFLEIGQPPLAVAVSNLAGLGVTRILVLPYFLTLGLHLKRDLPKLVTEAAAQHPAIEIITAPPLDGHPGLIDVLAARAAEFQN